jgi:hypothetical protein
VETVAARAEEGLNQNPSIKTFVIGVGQQLSTLNLIAQKGGTGQAILVSTANAAQEFKDALDKIRGGFVCQFLLPTPDKGEADPDKLNVSFTPPGGTPEIFPKVDSASQCLGQKAWYYDQYPNPKQILLCPAACDLVQNGQGAISIELGCLTKVT